MTTVAEAASVEQFANSLCARMEDLRMDVDLKETCAVKIDLQPDAAVVHSGKFRLELAGVSFWLRFACRRRRGWLKDKETGRSTRGDVFTYWVNVKGGTFLGWGEKMPPVVKGLTGFDAAVERTIKAISSKMEDESFAQWKEAVVKRVDARYELLRRGFRQSEMYMRRGVVVEQDRTVQQPSLVLNMPPVSIYLRMPADGDICDHGEWIKKLLERHQQEASVRLEDAMIEAGYDIERKAR